jgi:hypothetical protein
MLVHLESRPRGDLWMLVHLMTRSQGIRGGSEISRPIHAIVKRPWVATHPEQSRLLVTGILVADGLSVPRWPGSAQPVTFLCQIRKPAVECGATMVRKHGG